MTSNTYDFYNPLTLKIFLIIGDCLKTLYYMTLLVFIHATTRFPLTECLATRLLLGINLGCITCIWWFQWVSNYLELSSFYLRFGSPHDPDLEKFIQHLNNFSKIFALQACFLSFEQLYRVWGSVLDSKADQETKQLLESSTPGDRRRTQGIINYMYDDHMDNETIDIEVQNAPQRKTYTHGSFIVEEEYIGTAMSQEKSMATHGIAAAFQLLRIILGYLISLKISVNASIGVLSVELINHLLAFG